MVMISVPLGALTHAADASQTAWAVVCGRAFAKGQTSLGQAARSVRWRIHNQRDPRTHFSLHGFHPAFPLILTSTNVVAMESALPLR
jgi:hypothetical protein